MRQDIFTDGTRVGWAGEHEVFFQNTWRNAQNCMANDYRRCFKDDVLVKTLIVQNIGMVDKRYYVTDLLGGPEGSEANKFATLWNHKMKMVIL